jgi:hypothetical protein
MSLRVKKFLRGEAYLDPGFIVVCMEKQRKDGSIGHSYYARGTSGGKTYAVILSYDKTGGKNPNVKQLQAAGVYVEYESREESAARRAEKVGANPRKPNKSTRKLACVKKCMKEY